MSVRPRHSMRPYPVPNPQDRLREMLALHLHPTLGSEYWLRRQEELGWDLRDRIRTLGDLAGLAPMPLEELRRRPVRHFIPQTFHHQQERFITGETAGTSGRPCATAYRDDEFEAAFIEPFLRVAQATGFPCGASWLWIGPSGPHIIGKVVRELARRTGGIDPFSVDFDPRWAKKLQDGSFARQRYLDHVTSQALEVLEREDIVVLFATPPALAALGQRMSHRQRESIHGIHYGGMSLTPATVNEFRQVFPNAVHLAGYGNTLFGVAMEIADGPRTAMDYYPLGERVLFQVIRRSEQQPFVPVGPGERGRVLFHRFDESCLLLNVLERDEAERIPARLEAFTLGGGNDGLRNPAPPAELSGKLQHGLY